MALDTTTFGRTGLRVTVAGLGCGGHSRLGMARGATVAEAAAVVRHALERGVTLVDTAESYGTEEAVGMALAGRRDGVVLSTKVSPTRDGAVRAPDDLTRSLETSLRRLGTDRIDVYHMHGVAAEQYDEVVARLYPALDRARGAGKVRFLGITEAFGRDTAHAMLPRAVTSGLWDAVMVGFNILNPSARRAVLPGAIAGNVGVLCMFAVRRALISAEHARAYLDDLVARGEIELDPADRADPLGFLTAPGVAATLAEAAYRFCRHEPGIHCVLTGTGSTAHLDENLRSIAMPPLPPEARGRLERIFGRVDSVSGN